MQFKRDAKVYTSTGHEVGRVDRVVLDPKTKEVTHIVVRKGFLFTEDKLVPLNLIASANEDRVTLRPDASDLYALPPYEETHYIPLDEAESSAAAYPPDLAMPLYWYVPYGIGSPGYIPPPMYRAETERNTPANTVAVKEGAKVFSADDKEVGSVERVFTDSTTDQATYIVVSQGAILKEKKSVPMSWVRTVTQDEVHLSVGASVLDNLREYQEA